MSDSQFLGVTTTPNASIKEVISWFHLLLVTENQHLLNLPLVLATPLGIPSSIYGATSKTSTFSLLEMSFIEDVLIY